MNGFDFYEQLPNDFGPRGNVFKPLSQRAEKAGQCLKSNALPLLLFTIGGMI